MKQGRSRAGCTPSTASCVRHVEIPSPHIRHQCRRAASGPSASASPGRPSTAAATRVAARAFVLLVGLALRFPSTRARSRRPRLCLPLGLGARAGQPPPVRSRSNLAPTAPASPARKAPKPVRPLAASPAARRALPLAASSAPGRARRAPRARRKARGASRAHSTSSLDVSMPTRLRRSHADRHADSHADSHPDSLRR